MKKKKCSICGLLLPEDKKNFRYRIQDGKGYYTAECSTCIKKQKAISRQKAKEKRQAALAKIESAGVNEFIKAVSKGGSNIPHSAEVIEQVMGYFGGVAGFSAVLVKQYWDATPGGSARNRLLETMTRLVSKNVEQGGARKPLTLWSEDELERELEERLKTAVTVIQGDFTSGEEKTLRITEETSEGSGEETADPEASSDKVPKRRNKRTPKRDTGS